MPLKETLEEAQNFYDLGFKVIKVKTGVNLEEDIERILRLNELYKGKLKIRVDANQGYSIQDLVKFISTTEKAKLELIEQPLRVGKDAELLALTSKQRKLLTADESLKNAQAALKFANEPQTYGIFNIKLMKCGGIVGAFEIANIAKSSGIDLLFVEFIAISYVIRI